MEWVVKWKGSNDSNIKIKANTLWEAKRTFLKKNWKQLQEAYKVGNFEDYNLTEFLKQVDAKNANDHRKKISMIEKVKVGGD